MAGTLRGRARAARSAFANGTVGAVWMRGGQPKVVFWFTIEDGKIVSITLIADPVRLGRLDLSIIGWP